MRILITSGGTTETIDRVRGITNFATGNLGKLISERFLSIGHDVILLAGLTANVPDKHPNLRIIRISDISSLAEAIKKWVPKVDVVIHSMAVSDYTPIHMTDFKTVNDADNLNDFLTRVNTEKKIASRSDYQVLFLKKTPKIIATIKTINPKVILFGFKLLVDVPKEELVRVANASLIKNQADFILANDLTTITKTAHHGLLVGQDTVIEKQTKLEIADLIVAKSEEIYDKNHTCRNREHFSL